MSMNKIIQGDSKEILRTFGDNSFDGMLTDPPAGISFMGEKWDTFPKGGRGNSCRRTGSGNDCSSPGFACDVHWDKSLKARNQFISWLTDLMTEAKRILKPGGHAFVWALPRTSHWTAFALEEAGFEIRDCVYHIFGQGFSKSLNISKDIDRRACREQLEKKLGRKPTKEEFKKVWKGFREVVGHKPIAYPNSECWGIPNKNGIGNDKSIFNVGRVDEGGTRPITASVTTEAKKWEGWGTGLKPAVECWWLVRKPLSEKTVSENVLKWGVGGLNIDGGRIGYQKKSDEYHRDNRTASDGIFFKEQEDYELNRHSNSQGRFPANVILECICDEVVEGEVENNARKNKARKEKHNRFLGFATKDIAEWGNVDGKEKTLIHTDLNCPCYVLDEQSGVSKSSGGRAGHENAYQGGYKQNYYEGIKPGLGDSGGASRFFYCTKASRNERWFYCHICQDAFPIKEREGHKHGKPDNEQKHIVLHPTQKSEKLCKYLIRLITREGQIVLDPFMGTGTTCIACINTNRNYVGIELGIEYYEISRKRIEYMERKKQGELIIWK